MLTSKGGVNKKLTHSDADVAIGRVAFQPLRYASDFLMASLNEVFCFQLFVLLSVINVY